MYLKVHYKKEIHLLNRKVDFQELQHFITTTFKDAPAHFELSYLDSDGDVISLSNQEDLKTLYDTSGEGFTKVIVNEVAPEIVLKQSPLSITVDQNIEAESNSVKQQQGQQSEEKAAEQQKREEEPKEVSIQEETSQKQRQLEAERQKYQSLQCKTDAQPKQQLFAQGSKDKDDSSASEPPEPVEKYESPATENADVKKQEPKRIEVQPENNFNQLLLEKLDELIPSIVQKVKRILLEEKAEQSSHIHKVECNVCQVEQIRGIRYKCVACQKYNLCSICQEKTSHPHDLIKISKTRPAQIQKKQAEPKKASGAKEASRAAQKPQPEVKAKSKEKDIQADPKVIKQMIKHVKEILGEGKQIEDFVMKNYKEGVDRIVNMWFSKDD